MSLPPTRAYLCRAWSCRSTGLTFGTISALYGLNNNIITVQQFSILITAVILSAILLTMAALKKFKPRPEKTKEVIATEGAEG